MAEGSEFHPPDGFDAGPPLALWRFVIPTVVVVAMLAGGVFWIKRLPSPPPRSDNGGTIQVQLLQAPDPATLQLPPSERPSPAQNRGDGAETRGERTDAAVANDVSPPPLDPVAAPERASAPQGALIQAPPRDFPNDVVLQFQRLLTRHIERYQRYPDQAVHDRLEGTVQLAFVLGRDGKIRDAWIQSSSGKAILDSAAVDALQRAQPLPSIPNELPDQLKIKLPISFTYKYIIQ
jgi:protein TonB